MYAYCLDGLIPLEMFLLLEMDSYDSKKDLYGYRIDMLILGGNYVRQV